MNTSILENTCDELFEALSAWIDGQASPEEVRRVQAHLEGCPDCREVEEVLRGLAAAAPTVPIPEVPSGFAARTRKLVEDRAERAWDLRARRLGRRVASWLDGLLPAPDSLARALRGNLALEGAAGSLLGAASRAADALPAGQAEAGALAALLETRSQRAGLRPPSFWLLLALGLFGLPSGLLTLMGERTAAGNYLCCAALGLLAGLPWYHFRLDMGILVSLRRGRCLEEILGAGLEARSLVDSLASFSLRSLYRVALPVALVLLLGAPLAGTSDVFALAPMHRVSAAALSVVAWLVLVGGLFSVGSYAAQAAVLFSRGGERWGLASAGVSLVMMVPATGLVVGAVLAVGEGAGLAGALSLALVGAALWVGLVGRSLALWGMGHPAELERFSRATSPRRNRWVKAWSDNPIVAREAVRASAALPLGLAGLFLARLAPAVVQAQAAWWLAAVPRELTSTAFWLGVAVIGWLCWLRASARTSAALAQEREGGTLETMIQSGLTRQEFTSGWLQVACLPLYLELAVTAALVLWIAWILPEVVSGQARGVLGTLDLGAALLVLVALAAMPVGGAWSGLAVSAASSTRREAGGRAVGEAFLSLGSWIVAWGLSLTALMVATILFRVEFSSEVWITLVGAVLPAGALGLTVLGLTYRARRRVEEHLEARWRGAPVEPETTPSARGWRRRSLVLVPAGLAAVALLCQAVVVLAVPASGVSLTRGMELVWLFSALAAVAGLALLCGWLVRTLVLPLADHAGRSAWSSGAVAGVFGALFGASLGTTPLAVRILESWGLAGGPGLPATPEQAMGSAAALGFLAFALVAALGTQVLPMPEEERDLTLLERLRAEGGLPTTSALLALGLALGLVSWMAWQSASPVELYPGLAGKLVREAWDRDQQLAEVPARENGFALLETAFMSRKLELQGIQMARRDRALMEGFAALAWADRDSREECLRTLKADPARARASAAQLDATLPVLRQALAAPRFVAPPRLSEGPGGLVPNFLLMRKLTQGLRLRALMAEEQGDLAGALDLSLLNLRWSDRVAGQGVLINGMITVAMTSIAEEGLMGLLARHPLSEPDLRRVLAALDQGRFTPEAFRRNLDNEFCFGQVAFDQIERGRYEDLGQEWKMLLVLPGSYWRRERKVYTNLYLEQREEVLAGRPSGVQWELGIPSLSMAGALLPNLERASYQALKAFSRHNALRAFCLLELYRLRTGYYPANLDPVWTPAPGWKDTQDPLGRGRFLYRNEGKRFRLESDATRYRRFELDSAGLVEWFPGTKF